MRLHVAQPLPLQIWHCTSTSADGSVNGKNDGRNRATVSRAKNRLRKKSIPALKSTKVTPSSTTRPSICSKTGECEASNVSRRYTCPGTTMRMGGGYCSMMCACMGDVCVRSSRRGPR